MERTKRRWLIVGIGLCVGLVLALRWVTVPEQIEMDASTPALLQASPAPSPAPPPAERRPSETSAVVAPRAAIEGGTLRGRAFDAATGDAVKEFEVQLRLPVADGLGKEELISRRFRSANGQFAWQGAPSGTWRVMVIARGYQRFERSDLHIVKGELVPEIVAPLVPGQKVTGRVFDQASGVPIGSAQITWREAHLSHIEGMMHRPVEATSRPDGSFVLDGVPASRITITASAKEYAYREVDVVAGEETPPVEIGLGRGGLIGGQLTAADGTAVTGSLMLNHLDTNMGKGAQTGESGEFSFDRLQPGTYRLHGEAGGASTSVLEVVLAENERRDSITLALTSGRSVRGVVRSSSPEWVGRLRVSLRSQAKGIYFSSTLDDKGAFALHGIPPGGAQISVRLFGQALSSQAIDVPANADVTLDIDLPRLSRLSGRVTQNGTPRTGINVWIRPVGRSVGGGIGMPTSQTGTYEWSGLLDGEYEVQAEGDLAQRIRVSGDTVFDIELTAAQLAGRLFEEGSSVPIVGGTIHLASAKADAPGVALYKETDHSGQFSLVGLESGELLLSVYKPGYEMLRERVTYGGAPISDMTIRLRRNPGIEISAFDAQSGRPIRDLYLSETIGSADGISLRVRLDERGTGSIPSALAGSTLSISAQGYVPEIVRAWNAQPIELRLKRR